MKKILTVWMVATFVSSCGLVPSHGPAVQSLKVNRAEDMAAFQKTLFPVFRKYCSKCHSSQPVLVGNPRDPMIGDSSVAVAYFHVTSGLVDLENPSKSRIATRAGNNHCKHPELCSGPVKTEVVGAIKSWAALVSSRPNATPAPEPGPSRIPEVVVSASGLEAFKATLHPVLRAKCFGCHSLEHPLFEVAKTPVFSLDKEIDSYTVVRGLELVDFANPRRSKLAVRAGDGHCEAADICGSNRAVEPVRDEIVKQISAWWEQGEKPAASPPGQGTGPSPTSTPPPTENEPEEKVTVEVGVPSPLVTGTSFTPLTFPLDSLGGDFVGAKFEISIQRYNETNSYRFRKPRLITNSRTLYIENVNVLLNGNPNPGNSTYTSVATTIDGNSQASLSSAELIAVEASGPGQDKIAIQFGQLRVSNPVDCIALTVFQTTVKPVLSGVCFGCHANAGSLPNQRFTMGPNVDDSTLCRRAKQRTNRLLPSASVLVTNPFNQTNGHPTTGVTADQINAILSWIPMEY